ncbi:MAG: hypothetical protein DRJ03_01620 [Chloroflexi bacterium]|nr:MAG: hypothetical protein DRJ03_01620 [Chloroflexota bacterium]
MAYQKDASYDFGRSVRASIRGLWKGHLDLIGFVDTMTTAILRDYEVAWREGESRCGILTGERSLEESLALDKEIQNDFGYLLNFGEAILKLKERSEAGGKNAPTITNALKRGKVWENRTDAVRNLAQRMACSDQKLKWVLGRAEHCVVAGTIILTDRGEIPIEEVIVGDRVLTRAGFRKVTETFKHGYSGRMVELKHKGDSVKMTEDHLVLTGRGWVEARYLRLDDIMLSQDIGNCVRSHITFPYSFNNIIPALKIVIASAITFLLRKLPISKWRKSGMSMPIVAIGLDDEIICNKNINYESWFNDYVGLERNPKIVENRMQLQFKTAGVISSIASGSINGVADNNFRMFFSPLLNSVNSLFGFHGIMKKHIIPGTNFLSFFSDIRRKALRVFLKDNANTVDVPSDYYGNLFGGMRFVEINNLIYRILRYSRRVIFAGSGTRHIGTGNRTKLAPNATSINNVRLKQISANRTWDWLELSGFVPASWRTKTAKWIRRINIAFKRLSAELTSKLFNRHSSIVPFHHTPIIALNHYFTNGTAVYNLEIDDLPEFFANGILIHNCIDCLNYSGRVYRASIWAKYDIRPQHPNLACHGYNCKCHFEVTTENAWPGRPPGMTGG